MRTFNQIVRKYFSSDSKILPLYDQMCAIQKAQYDACKDSLKGTVVSTQGKMLKDLLEKYKDLFGKESNDSPSIYAYQKLHEKDAGYEKGLPIVDSPDKSDDRVYKETEQIFQHMQDSLKFPNLFWHAHYNRAIAKCKKDGTVPPDSRLIEVYKTVTGETVENA